jgi:hypothetical protein
VPQAGDRHQQQARLGDQCGFLRQGKGVGLGPGVRRAPQHVLEGDPGRLADLRQAR